ncbi:MAG: glycosyltransferase 87 family protein [Promethearchaeota archaeon]
MSERQGGINLKIRNYIIIIICIFISLTIVRIILYFMPMDFAKDIDFKILYSFMNSDITNYYNQCNKEFDARPLYLYFWYYLFYPISLIPFIIAVYLWDALRLITTLYLANYLLKITDDDKILQYFLMLHVVGFFFDMYFNNTNWLIYLLLYQSYIHYEKNNKVLSGIFFTLATFKINTIVFPIIIFLNKKIKPKDLLYFIIPFTLICLPYILFPDYFFKMYYNWSYIENGAHVNNFNQTTLWIVYQLSWQLVQPAQLMFAGFIYLCYFKNLHNEKWKIPLAKLIFAIICILILINVLGASITYFLIMGDPDNVLSH